MSNLDLIQTDYGPCNLNCIFCRLHKKPPKNRASKKEILDKLKERKTKGITKIKITSGAPLLDPNIFDYLQFAKKLGFKSISIETNGIKLSEDEFVKKIANIGDFTFLINTPSHKKEVYEEISQTKGSFEKYKKALINISKYKFGFIGNIALTNLNYKFEDVKGLIKFLKELELNLNMITLRPLRVNFRGSGEEKYLTNFTDLGKELKKIIKYCEHQNIEVRGMPAFSIPLCACPGIEWLFSENLKNKWNQMEWFYYKSDICKKCSIIKYCPGILKFYNEKFKPIPYDKTPKTLFNRF